MVTLLEINKAVNDRLKAALAGTEFEAVKIVAEDMAKGVDRPSFKVSIDNSQNGKFNSSCREKTLTIRIYFFAKERYNYKIDNVKMQDIIEGAFLEDLEVKEGFFIPIDTVESEVADTVLICTFDLYAVELLPDTDSSEPMETLLLQ